MLTARHISNPVAWLAFVLKNTHSRQVGEDELADKITKDDAKAAVETIRLITEYFQVT